MVKSVRNVTSESLKITAETILNPKTKFELRLIAGGIYQLEPTWVYPELEDSISRGELVVISSEDDEPRDASSVERVTSDPTPSVAAEDVIAETPSATEEEPAIITDSLYICDICGESFGSLRGLQMHKSRTHKDS